MKKTILICGLLLPFLLTAQRQGQSLVDSLIPSLSAAGDDTNKVNTLNTIAFTLHSLNPDEGLKYARSALDLAMKLKWQRGMATAYSRLGSNYENKSQYAQALENHFEALKIFESIDDNVGIANNTGSIGIVYYDLKNYPKALKYDSAALLLAIRMGDKEGISRNMGNMGSVYTDMNDLKTALTCDSTALAIDQGRHDKQGMAVNMGNMGIIYQFKNDLPRALEFCLKALKLDEEIGDRNSMAINLGNIGHIYLLIAQDTTTHIRADSLISASRSDNLAKAKEYLMQAMVLSKETGDIDGMREEMQNLSEVYALSGEYRAALESYRQYTAFKDTIFSAQSAMKVANLETQKDIDIKNKEIEIQTLRNRIAIGALLLLLLAIGFVFRNFKAQQRLNSLLSTEKKRSDDLLLNILPVEVAEELKDTGGAVAKYFDNVTVLFTDFVDFTKTSERITAQQLVNELDICFKAFDGIIGRYKIEKIKTIGDAYLAVSGLPAGNEEHATDILHAAIEIRQYMAARRSQLGDQTFEIRIGIHTGNVVAGIVGVRKFAYDIWGDTVNTAARMEQNSQPGRINISQTTYEIVKDKFTCVYRGEIEAKNKGLLKMYFVE